MFETPTGFINYKNSKDIDFKDSSYSFPFPYNVSEPALRVFQKRSINFLSSLICEESVF